ncbi:MAG TPA: FmdB family zinc ribbon protein [Acidimicrobiales bacterium]|nr:FmdB family zinc ribbon protein [Acidimicrobiales bacterium]
MPTYEYACKSCSEHLEVVQRFTDDALTECPTCEGKLRKVFSAVGITFKGSGFYKTDSRSGARRSSGGESGSDTSTPSSDGAKSESKKSESTGSVSKGSSSTDSASSSSSTTTTT